MNLDILSKVVGGLIVASIVGAVRYVYYYLRNRRLIERLKEDGCTLAEIKKSVVHSGAPYIRPDCQDDIPADPGPAVNRRAIFREVDRLLGPPRLARFTLILADTGMGKSEFLERYYAYHWRSPKRNSRFKAIVLRLNGLDVDDLVKRIDAQAHSETVLLLDALDEDRAAMDNFANRFNDLVRLAGEFYAIVVTCRTQFLTEAACVPEEIELPPTSGPMPLLVVPDRMVRRLYLSSFSDAQVRKYLAARFPYWRHPALRVRARRAADRFRDLVSRPVLLTFIQDLSSSSEEPEYPFQAYRVIVASWLERERTKKTLKIQPKELLRFCEEFAVSLFTTGRDRVPLAELQSMVGRFGVGGLFSQVRERSLLHNDAEGNWKFAHRSIMEYLVVTAACQAENPPPWAGQPWTDQMRKFAKEMLISGECKRLPGADLRGVDLEGVDLLDCDLSVANLSGANLSGANLRNSRLDGTNLSDANLTEACVENAYLDFANLHGACLDRTVFGRANLEKVRRLTLVQAAAASADEMTVWPVRVLKGHSEVVQAVALTADGKRAVSASHDNTVWVWDLEGNLPPRVLEGHTGPVLAVALTADGKRAVSASRDNTVRVWDLEGNRPLGSHRLAIDFGNIPAAVALTADGKRAVAADYTLRVWDLEGELPARSQLLLYEVPHFTTAVALMSDGKHAVSASSDYKLWVWDLEPDLPRPLRLLEGHGDRVTAVVLTSDGKRAVSASQDATLRVWDLEGNLPPLVLKGHTGPVLAVALTTDGEHAVSASEDHTLRVWNLEGNLPPLVLKGHTNVVRAVALTTDGKRAVSASDDNTLRLWFPPDEPESSPH